MNFKDRLTCHKCNKEVEIVSTTRISNEEEQDNFSCGHSRKSFHRTNTDSFSISDSISTQAKRLFYKIRRSLNFFKKS